MFYFFFSILATETSTFFSYEVKCLWNLGNSYYMEIHRKQRAVPQLVYLKLYQLFADILEYHQHSDSLRLEKEPGNKIIWRTGSKLSSMKAVKSSSGQWAEEWMEWRGQFWGYVNLFSNICFWGRVARGDI